MAMKILNASTDVTLGGENASNEVVSSQKAIKVYIDDKFDNSGIDSALQPEDVTSTYNPLGTEPVNGTAIAGALSTLDIPIVDQTYSASSTNAQSGTAVASALDSLVDLIPDVDQTYSASSTNAQSGTAVASALANINVGVDQTYSASSTVAQSGTAVAEALLTLDIPAVDQTYLASSTNAQSGTAVAEAISSILPSQTGQSGKFLTTDGTVASWAEVQGGNVASGNAGYTASCPALTLSDGKLTWVVTHNLNTGDIIASLYTSAGAELMKDVTIDSVNQITVTFVAGANASAGDYKIVVMSTRSFAIDSSLSTSSTNPVQNSVVTTALNNSLNVNASNLSSDGQKVFDGQWVSSPLALVNNESYPTTTNVEHILSNYLPEDNYNYEVIAACATRASVGEKQMRIELISDIIDGSFVLGDCISSSSKQGFGSGTVSIPVGIGRKITTVKLSWVDGTYSIWLRGYRRIGTNS